LALAFFAISVHIRSASVKNHLLFVQKPGIGAIREHSSRTNEHMKSR